MDIEEGDDCIAVKSGLNAAGRAFGVPSKNILFERITCKGQAIAVGSEMSGGVENITFRHIVLHEGVDRGCYIKTGNQRGGYVKDIFCEHVRTTGVGVSQFLLGMTTNYESSSTPYHPLPNISNIHYTDIVGLSLRAGEWPCTTEIPCSFLTLTDIHAYSVLGFSCGAGVRNVNVSNVRPSFCHL
jgi:hypothetical protein